MGATIREVIMVVSREMVFLMGISVLLAWLISYLFMQRWLQDFPFNIGFQAWIYLVAAISAMMIALLTVFLLAYRSAVRNPATVLYHE